jgi:hypothetical protein
VSPPTQFPLAVSGGLRSLATAAGFPGALLGPRPALTAVPAFYAVAAGLPGEPAIEPSGIIRRSVSSFSIVPSVISPVLFMLRQFMLP